MPYLITIYLLILNTVLSFSQEKNGTIEYLYDENESYNNTSIINSNSFSPLIKDINNGLQNGVYWFKITNLNTKKTSIQIINNRISEANAYQESIEIPLVKNERFLTFNTKKKATIYLKVNATREALIPIRINSFEKFSKNERSIFLFLGFYYGFAFVIGLINLFYFINFKDRTFLYYTLFIFSISSGFSISDGLLFSFNYNVNTINIIEIFDHFFIVIFGILFSSSFLQSDNYYSKSKKTLFTLSAIVLILGFLFIFTKHHIIFVIMESLAFAILIYLWLASFLLYSKSTYNKVFTIAFFFILLLGLSFYINKLFGLPVILNSTLLKLGAFFEMIILSFAVIYRMKTIHDQNTEMRKEITLYVKTIENISQEIPKKEALNTIKIKETDLTPREVEILYSIVEGKSNKEISEELNISINTVKYHVKNIYDKLNIKSRREVKNFNISL